MIKVNTITLKKGEPFVKFASPVGNEGTKDSVFPGKGSPPVIPSSEYCDALADFLCQVQSAYWLSIEYDWKLTKIDIIYNEETGEVARFKANVSGFSTSLGKQTAVLDPQSKQNVDHAVLKSLKELVYQSEMFVAGASAQTSLFNVAVTANDKELEMVAV